jgi:hypothetical protein
MMHSPAGRAEKLPSRERKSMGKRYNVSPHVCSNTNKDGSIILDIDGGLIFSLIGVGSLIWAKLNAHPAGLTVDDVVCLIESNFDDVPRPQIQRDVNNILNQLVQKKLVSVFEGKVQGASERTRLWLNNIIELLAYKAAKLLVHLKLNTVAAFLGLAMINVVLRVGGFRALHYAVKRWPVNSSASPDAQREVCKSVDRATNWYPSQAMCLQRSAITACLLRQYGVLAHFVIGCRKIPFKAHAWVEVEGKVINDKRQVQEFYSVLERC